MAVQSNRTGKKFQMQHVHSLVPRPHPLARGSGSGNETSMFNELEKNKIIIYTVRIIRASTVEDTVLSCY